jgi:hypothetical protein
LGRATSNRATIKPVKRTGAVVLAIAMAMLWVVPSVGSATTSNRSAHHSSNHAHTISVTAAAQQYLALQAPVNAAGETFAQRAPTWSALISLSDAHAAGLAKPFVSALEISDQRLARDDWPTAAKADIAALLAASERFQHDYGELATMTESRESAWILNYDRDNNEQGLLAEIVRHDLGLPSGQSFSSTEPANNPQAAHSLVAAQKQYRAIAEPFYLAAATFSAKEKDWTRSTAPADAEATAQLFVSALLSMDQSLTVDSWPHEDQGVIKKSVAASAFVAGDLEAIGNVNASTSGSLSATLSRDSKRFNSAAAKVRQALDVAPLGSLVV